VLTVGLIIVICPVNAVTRHRPGPTGAPTGIADFHSHIQALRKEGGTKWMSVFLEYHEMAAAAALANGGTGASSQDDSAGVAADASEAGAKKSKVKPSKGARAPSTRVSTKEPRTRAVIRSELSARKDSFSEPNSPTHQTSAAHQQQQQQQRQSPLSHHRSATTTTAAATGNKATGTVKADSGLPDAVQALLAKYASPEEDPSAMLRNLNLGRKGRRGMAVQTPT